MSDPQGFQSGSSLLVSAGDNTDIGFGFGKFKAVSRQFGEYCRKRIMRAVAKKDEPFSYPLKAQKGHLHPPKPVFAQSRPWTTTKG